MAVATASTYALARELTHHYWATKQFFNYLNII